eukprot:UN24666
MALFVRARKDESLTYAHTPFFCVDCHRGVYRATLDNYKEFNKMANDITRMDFKNVLLFDLSFRCEFERYHKLDWAGRSTAFNLVDKIFVRQQYSVGSSQQLVPLYDPDEFNCVIHHRTYREGIDVVEM